jgi:hypothetical protein
MYIREIFCDQLRVYSWTFCIIFLCYHAGTTVSFHPSFVPTPVALVQVKKEKRLKARCALVFGFPYSAQARSRIFLSASLPHFLSSQRHDRSSASLFFSASTFKAVVNVLKCVGSCSAVSGDPIKQSSLPSSLLPCSLRESYVARSCRLCLIENICLSLSHANTTFQQVLTTMVHKDVGPGG